MKEITSLQHPLVKHLVKLRQNSDYRYDHQSIIIEGIKTIQEANAANPFTTLMASSEELIPKGIKAKEILLTTPSIIEKISGLKNPEGILAEVAMPKDSNFEGLKYVLALDGINDPGNLGTILRTALAFGWEGVFFLDESCDPYNDKALRASRGAVFKIPMKKGCWNDLQRIINENQLTPLVADIHGSSFDQIQTKEGMLLVLGNEAHGPSKESLSACKAITIPMSGMMESLNVSVAAGILLYTLRKSSIHSEIYEKR